MLKLSPLLYDKESINTAITDYASQGKIELEEKNNQILLSFQNYATTDILEFQNYLLSIVKNNRSNFAKKVIMPDLKIKSESKEIKYGFLPYYLKKINLKYLIANRLGSWCFLTKEEVANLSNPNSLLIKKLKREKLIIDQKNVLDLIKDFRKLNKNLFQGPSLHIVSLTSSCNLNCTYCHAGSPENPNVFLKKDVAVKIIEKIFECPNRALSIEFQGGEPMINWDTLKFFVEFTNKINKLEKKKIRFLITSNLNFIDNQKLDFLVENDFSICTSLDGPEIVHNHNRSNKGGDGSYEKLLNNINRIQTHYKKRNKGEELNALVTVSKISLKYANEIVDEYAKLNFKVIHLRYLDFSGLTPKNWEKIGYTSKEFVKFWKTGVDRIMELNKQGTMIKERTLLVLLEKVLKKNDAMYTELMNPCGAGRGQIAYTENGDVLTCDDARSVPEDVFKMGNVMTNTYKEIMASPVLLNMLQASLLDIYNPHDIFNVWNGICPVENWNRQGNIVSKLSHSLRYKIHYEQIKYFFELLENENNYKIFLNWI